MSITKEDLERWAGERWADGPIAGNAALARYALDLHARLAEKSAAILLAGNEMHEATARLEAAFVATREAEQERDAAVKRAEKAEAKAAQHAADWYAAKSEFGDYMAKQSALVRAADAERDDARADMLSVAQAMGYSYAQDSGPDAPAPTLLLVERAKEHAWSHLELVDMRKELADLKARAFVPMPVTAVSAAPTIGGYVIPAGCVYKSWIGYACPLGTTGCDLAHAPGEKPKCGKLVPGGGETFACVAPYGHGGRCLVDPAEVVEKFSRKPPPPPAPFVPPMTVGVVAAATPPKRRCACVCSACLATEIAHDACEHECSLVKRNATPTPDDGVHERGWQWCPVTDDTAFAPPFGTIRVCRSCGCLVAGGPTACVRCVDAEGQR